MNLIRYCQPSMPGVTGLILSVELVAVDCTAYTDPAGSGFQPLPLLNSHSTVAALLMVAVIVAVELEPHDAKPELTVDVGGSVGQIKFDTVIQPAGVIEATR